jgi:hypothetical protein
MSKNSTSGFVVRVASQRHMYNVLQIRIQRIRIQQVDGTEEEVENIAYSDSRL